MAIEYISKSGALYIVTKVKELLSKKVDKVDGKVLSTNDYTTTEKNKLSGIASGATKVIVDAKLADTTNAIQNTVVNSALAGKVDKANGKGLSSNDYTNDEKTKLSGIAAGATKVIVDASLNGSSTNAIQNKVVNTALSGKAPIANPSFSGTPKAPTAAAGNNTTQIATTAFVTSAVAKGISGITGIKFEKVDVLPASGKNGVIYLVPNNSGKAKNIYDEYIWTETAFEKIGTTEQDLSGYLKSSDLVEVSNSEIDAMFK